MTKLIKTNDYSLLKKHESNRDIDVINLKRITASLKVNNMLQLRPIIVDENMCIIDGQHRFEAAKALGIEIWYQIKEDSHTEDIILLNTCQKSWQLEDYIKYYSSMGNEHYEKIIKFSNECNISLKHLCSIFLNDGGGARSKVKLGKFQFPENQEIERYKIYIKNSIHVIELIKKYSFNHIKCLKAERFINSLILFIKNPAVDFDKFCQKIVSKVECIRACTSTKAYFDNFKYIYNWKNQNPID